MDAVRAHLVRRDAQLVLLLTPPFDRMAHDPGYIKGYVPGVRENGGQYTHAALWAVIALARLGMGDEAMELFHMINPINHMRTAEGLERYRAEPYVVAADVYAHPMHVGRGGWTWYTGFGGMDVPGGGAGAPRAAPARRDDQRQPLHSRDLAAILAGVDGWAARAIASSCRIPSSSCGGIESAELDGVAVDAQAIPMTRRRRTARSGDRARCRLCLKWSEIRREISRWDIAWLVGVCKTAQRPTPWVSSMRAGLITRSLTPLEVTHGFERHVRVRDSDREGQVPRQRRGARRQAVFQGHGRDRSREERDLERDQDDPDLAERHRRRHPGDGRAARRRAPRGRGKTYTVKAGDTLSGIAKEHLGSAGAYMKIFELNKDQLTDPDKIKPGQVLRIP